ncbi:50S ribosomal protein L18 [Synechococcus sp. R55.3]|jgi:large subunit ribosomal protein L18|uniref:50S ribosomal protein L18 n=1 Tax=unclassified Synechococcus TaxID=2626047 RepID=UPI0039C1A7B7
MKASRKITTQRRHRRIRRKVFGTAERPRLAVFRSHRHIYAQVIDDVAQHTLASASTLDRELREKFKETGTATQEAAALVGRSVAERALQMGISRVVFDRGGKLYHGRVQALAEAAREAGLQF